MEHIRLSFLFFFGNGTENRSYSGQSIDIRHLHVVGLHFCRIKDL